MVLVTKRMNVAQTRSFVEGRLSSANFKLDVWTSSKRKRGGRPAAVGTRGALYSEVREVHASERSARVRAGRHHADRNRRCCAGAIIRPNAGALLSSKATRLTRGALCSEVREVRASTRSAERALGCGAGCLVV